ncbi:MAG: hypothetical protein OXU37_03430 [Thaumarchaeota archaeon]|nr:hypothetical protein [Nitrososphaerota archaeon]
MLRATARLSSCLCEPEKWACGGCASRRIALASARVARDLPAMPGWARR